MPSTASPSKPRRSVTAVFCFNANGEVGIVRKHNGRFGFPGGRIDEGDIDIAGAALREFREEFSEDEITLRRLTMYKLPKKNVYAYLAFGEVSNINPSDTKEIARAVFTNPENAARLVPAMAAILSDAVQINAAIQEDRRRQLTARAA